MKRTYDTPENALEVAKEALWLAWQASSVFGMGFLQDEPSATRDKVVERTLKQGDYPAKDERLFSSLKIGWTFNADYVYGRMMKLRFSVDGAVIEYPDFDANYEYQSWAVKYKGHNDLFNAAERAVDIFSVVPK